MVGVKENDGEQHDNQILNERFRSLSHPGRAIGDGQQSQSPMRATEPSQRPKSTTQRVEFLITVVLAAVFVVFFVADEDPYSLGAGFFSLFVYAIAVVFSFTLARRPRAIPILVVLSLAAVGLSWAVRGDGYPVTSATLSYTSTCISVTNSTTGYVYQACRAVPSSGQDVAAALGWNFLAWAPLMGCLLYEIPFSERGRILTYGTAARMLRGAVPAAALMFILLGARSSGLIGSPIVGLGPLDPYVAFRECDSTSSLNGCSFNNSLYLLVDFLFWLAIALLSALLAGEAYVAYERTRGRRSSIEPPAKWAAVALAVLAVLGATVVPATLTQGGAIVTSGSSFQFPSYDYYLNIPVAATQRFTLVGSFSSNIPVDVYLLNYTQWDNSFGPYCPLQTTALFINATGGTIDAPTPRGSYNLVFCPVAQPPSEVNVTILVTSPIRFSPWS